nr:reverse transcriptase domain-containing protein [Tanacetum cinerariifolium]
MAALVISISLDSSDERLGSSILQVILIGSIPIEVLVVLTNLPFALEVGVAVVASPAESDTEFPERHVSSTPHDAMVSRWRIRVASRPSLALGSLSHTTSTIEIPTAPIQPAPPAIISPSTNIISPIVAPPGALIARKLVGPLPSHRLALRYTSHHLDCFTSGSSSNHSSFDHSSADHTSESSPSDSPATTSDRHSYSSSHSTGPSPKRCMSPATTVSSSIPALGALVPTRTDLLPPHKRLQQIWILIKAGVDAGIGIEVEDDIEDEDEGEAKPSDRGTIEVGVDMVAGIDIPDGMLLPDAVEHLDQVESLIALRERSSLLDHVTALEKSNVRLRDTIMMESMRVDRLQREHDYHSLWYDPVSYWRTHCSTSGEGLATYEAHRAAKLVVESQSQNGNDGDNENGGGNGDKNGKGNGNINGGGNRNGNPNRNNKGAMPVTPIVEKSTKYDTCTLLNNALTWWNSHKSTIGDEFSFAMSWRELMKLMTKVYCPRNEIQKMETELWNLTVKGNDLTAYTQIFQELTMLCTKMVPKEEDRVEKFIGGLPNNIQKNVIALKPTRLWDAIRIANNLMDQKLKVYAAKSMENKKGLDFNQKYNHTQQPPYKRQNVGR